MPSTKTLDRTMTPVQIEAKARKILQPPEAIFPLDATCKKLELNSGSFRRKVWNRGIAEVPGTDDVVCILGSDFLTLVLDTTKNLKAPKPQPPIQKPLRAGVVALLREASFRQGELSQEDLKQIAMKAGTTINTVKDIERVLSRSLVTRLIEQLARHTHALKDNTVALNANTKAMHGVLTSGQ